MQIINLYKKIKKNKKNRRASHACSKASVRTQFGSLAQKMNELRPKKPPIQ